MILAAVEPVVMCPDGQSVAVALLEDVAKANARSALNCGYAWLTSSIGTARVKWDKRERRFSYFMNHVQMRRDALEDRL